MTEAPAPVGGPLRELTYRLTPADFASWNDARARAIRGTPPNRRVYRAGRWIWYFVVIFGWATAFAVTVATLIGDRWQTAAFIVGVVIVSGTSAITESNRRQANADYVRQAFEASLYGQGMIVLRIDDRAVEISYGEVLYRIAWAAVVAVHRAGSVIILACDRALGGIAVPLAAFTSPAEADAFQTDAESRVAATRAIAPS